jgi:glycosyltransferase involved in cell wall biosynthesis
MKEFPLVSIITPVYNGAEYLEELIQSVLQQDYPNIEHLIIDDGSQDDGATVATLEKYSHLRWWSRANKGQYATMNEGLLAAQGEIVCFVSADDVVSSGAVRSAMDFLAKCPNYDGVFGVTNYIDNAGKINDYFIPFRSAPIRFYPYFAHISHCSLYVKRFSILKQKVFFDPSLQYIGDYDWIVRIYKSGLRIGVINRELSKVRVHVMQTTQRQQIAFQAEKRKRKQKIIEDLHINRAIYFLLRSAYIMLVRVWKIGSILRDGGIKSVVERLSAWYKKKYDNSE